MERFFRRALLVLFAVLLITGAATCMIFQHNLKEKLRQESLQHLTDVKADLDAMLDAKKNPGDHQDLIVRIGGFSIKFIELRPEAQDEIIKRYA